MLLKERSQVDRAVRDLSARNDRDLASRLVLDLGSGLSNASSAESLQIVTVSVGAPGLLLRALHLLGILRNNLTADCTVLDGPVSPCDDAVHVLFRGQARLALPQNPPGPTSPWVFAAAVLRPDRQSLLVRCVPLGVDSTNMEGLSAEIAKHAESVIREFVLQWHCQRAIWERPAEETLPEFVEE